MSNIAGIPQSIEPVVCDMCGHCMGLPGPPGHRRQRKDHHMRLEDAVFYSLKARCAPYGSMNNGVAMILYKLDQYEIMESKTSLMQKVKVRSLDDEVKGL